MSELFRDIHPLALVVVHRETESLLGQLAGLKYCVELRSHGQAELAKEAWQWCAQNAGAGNFQVLENRLETVNRWGGYDGPAPVGRHLLFFRTEELAEQCRKHFRLK